MVYWSSEEVPAIARTTRTQDTTERLQPKSTGSNTAYAVAATSYALLAYMQNVNKGEEKELLDPIQQFLQEQHMWVGGFSSSQVCCRGHTYNGRQTTGYALHLGQTNISIFQSTAISAYDGRHVWNY